MRRLVQCREGLGAEERGCEELVLRRHLEMRLGDVDGGSRVDHEPCHGAMLRARPLRSTTSLAPPWHRLHRPAESVARLGDPMRIDHQVVVFDAADLAAESSFWAGVLEGTVDAEDDWHMVIVQGEPRVGVQLAPNHVPPDWPDGTPEQQIHLDLWVDDFAEVHDRVISGCESP